jgi:hypothetical protein
MTAMTDDDDLASGPGMALAFKVDAAHERAGGIQNGKLPLGGLALHCLRNTMGAEDGDRAVRNFRNFVDENRALPLEVLYNATVMHDLMAHIDRPAGLPEGILDGQDGPFDACAESAGSRKQNRERRLILDHAASSVVRG